MLDYAGHATYHMTKTGTLGSTPGPGGGLGYANTASSSNYLSYAGAVLTAVPCTMCIWFKPADTATTYDLMGVSKTGAFDAIFIETNPTGSSATVTARSDTSAGGVSAVTTTTYQAGVWNHACATYLSATSRAAYLNGGGKGTNATSRTPGAATQTSLGMIQTTGVFGPISGGIADARIYNYSMTDAQVMALYDPQTRWDLYAALSTKVYFLNKRAPAPFHRSQRFYRRVA